MNLYAKAFWSNNPIPVNKQISSPDFIIKVPIGVVIGSTSDVTKSYVDQQGVVLQDQITALDNNKLDASAYVQHFRGVFVDLTALQTAIPVANDGDYAHIDMGVGFDRKVAIWDNDDNQWIESTGSVALTTDEVTEGSTNRYFTEQRVRDTTLTGLSPINSAVLQTDTEIQAFSKLQGQINALPISATNWVDISTLTGYVKNSAVSNTGTKVEVAKFDGLLWIRGFVTTTTNVASGTILFSYTDPNYIWNYIDRNSTFSYTTLLNRSFLYEILDYKLNLIQIFSGSGSHTMRIVAGESYGSAIAKGVIPPTAIGKSF